MGMLTDDKYFSKKNLMFRMGTCAVFALVPILNSAFYALNSSYYALFTVAALCFPVGHGTGQTAQRQIGRHAGPLITPSDQMDVR